MADNKRSTSNERRRRPTPTIDLSATEVTPEPSQTAEDTEASPAGNDSSGRHPILFALLAGGAAGTVVVLAGLWLSGLVQFDSKSTDNTLASRIAALEAQAKAKPADDLALADMGARIAKLEAASAERTGDEPNAALAERLAALENAMKALGVTLAALNRRVEDSSTALASARGRADAAAKAVEAQQARLDAIEQSAKAVQDKIAQAGGPDITARRALAAAVLRDAVARGVPYSDELDTVKRLGAKAPIVAALEPFAASGAPTEAALSRELYDLLPSMVAAGGADGSKAGGFFERLQANAGKLVRIRPLDAPTDNDASAVLARIEVKTSRGDLSGVDGDLDKLPPNVRALAAAWRKKFAARNAAVAASRQLADTGAAALGLL